MPAKEIIDLDIEYVRGLNTVIGGLKEDGYEHKGDLGIQGREAFKPVLNFPAESLPSHHYMHVRMAPLNSRNIYHFGII